MIDSGSRRPDNLPASTPNDAGNGLPRTWDGNDQPYQRKATLEQLFLDQVQKAPEAIALQSGTSHIKYGELNNWADVVAQQLVEIGAKAGDLIGVHIDRSVEFVVAILGVLKVGAAYVPLAPDYPPERLRFMIEESGVRLLLTLWPPPAAISAGLLTILLPDKKRHSGSIPSVSQNITQANSPAYVMFTSGSTGHPKGVVVPHRAVVRLVMGQDYIPFGPALKFLLLAPVSFDASTLEIWGALLHGGCCVVYTDKTLSFDTLEQVIQVGSVSCLWLTSGLFNEIIDLRPTLLQTVDYVLTGGEALSVKHVQKALQALTGTRLINGYGPTEGTTFTTTYEIPLDWDGTRISSVPIGRPLANTLCYILDSDLQPVLPGVVGELFIGGDGLALGYHNRPELTDDKFITNPFMPLPGARLYRTGDLVRCLPDGNIEFVGRLDHQVKLRGFRVEPGEIESALARQPTIKAAIVTTHVVAEGDTRLVAYITAHPGVKIATMDARAHLKDILPDYMIPAIFVVLDRIPLTPNGKVDRAALPSPDFGVQAGDRPPYVAPRTPTEKLVAQVWSELLRVEPIGGNDNFFRLGGHSLLAMRATVLLGRALGKQLPVRILFSKSTVCQCASEFDLLGPAESKLPPLSPSGKESDAVASYAQQRLWFLDQYDPAGSAYNLPLGIALRGPLDIGVLTKALGEVVRRHTALRTVFHSHDGQLGVKILPHRPVELPLTDLMVFQESERSALASSTAEAEARVPFNLAEGPLLRARLIRLGVNHHWLIITQHHIVSDGWSFNVLRQELELLYSVFQTGRPNPLSEPAIQYTDYARWQREWLKGPELDRQVEYWRQQLAGAPELLDLPLDRPRAANQSFRGGLVTGAIPADLSQDLDRIAQRHAVTRFMLLLAGFQSLLHRYSRQDDIVVGSPFAERDEPGTEGLIGFFVNTLPLRADLAGDPTFVNLLEQTRNVVLGALAHQSSPFEVVVERLNVPRSPSHAPVFQVVFGNQNLAPAAQSFSGLKTHPLDIATGGSKFDLSVNIEERTSGLHLSLEYNSDLFHRQTAVGILECYKNLLRGVAENPNRNISQLPLLTNSEADTMIRDWSGDDRPYQLEVPLHRWIEAQIERTPGEIAVRIGDRELSYHELGVRSRQLANHLRSLGIGPNALVAVCMERSIEMVVSLLAVLQAGGAYVPIDPEYPPERVAFMIDDANAGVLLTTEQVRPLLPRDNSRVVCVDTGWEEIARSPNCSGQTTNPGDLAYMIYTSGSTGRPKGARNTHRGVVNRLLWMQEEFELTASDSVLQKTPFSFDVSVWEFFWPLMTGARLVLARPGGHRDPDYLCELIQRERITVVHFVPSMLAAFLDAPEAARCTVLREVICSGEALPLPLQHRFFSVLSCRLHNLYGPTEAAVDVTCWHCIRDTRLQTVPIGKPIANTRCYILDARMQPTPTGVPGELYLGGVQVGAGYHNRPELTAEKFVADPFEPGPGRRLYRTGDLARWLPDGNIEFMGRLDQQVKLRGFRIELGEIEAALASLPGIREAIVLPHEVVAGDVRLVAYLIANPNHAIGLVELRILLQKTLPDYMVPALFIFLDKIPVTPNGKTDRKALPQPDFGITPGIRSPFVEPATPTEKLVAKVWAELLKLERIGSLDHFFELGGHSLLAMRMVSIISRKSGRQVRLRSLFDHPTVSRFAANVDQAPTAQAPLPPLIAAVGGLVPTASFAQQRLWFLDQYQPAGSAYNLPLAIEILGPLDEAALANALNTIERRHGALRTVFLTEAGELRVEITAARQKVLPVVDLMVYPASERSGMATLKAGVEAGTPFDLAKGPLIRASLLRLDTHHHWLVVTHHHIVSDGWSISVFQRELACLYEAYSEGAPNPLPELPLQYADYARWQREWLHGRTLDRQIQYWKQQLSGAPVLLDLPLDRPRPATQSFRGGLVTAAVSAEFKGVLDRMAQQRGVTGFMLLLAAFHTLLHRYSRQDDIIVGSPVAERDEPDTDGMIGFFVNTLPLRVDLAGEPTFAILLERVRNVVLDALSHQSLPFEVLVEHLKISRSTSHSPIFQVVFGVQGTPPARRSFGGLEVRTMDIATGGSKFDLSLNIDERTTGLHLSLEYNSDLFESRTASRFLAHYTALLASIAENPHLAISRVPILNAHEATELTGFSAGNTTQYPRDASLDQVFLAQVERTPEAVALSSDDRIITYNALNQMACHVARHLQAAGAGPGSCVGLHIDRSVEFIVAMLGILKAGAAYVPLAAEYPADRLGVMLAEAGARLILSGTGLSWQPAAGIEVLNIHELQARTVPPLTFQQPAICATAPAYIMFTSGSTGRPKGVVVPHRAILRLVFGQEYLPFGPALNFLLLAPVSFDASTLEIWGPLLRGGRCVLYSPKHVALDGLQQTLRTGSVSCLWLTSSLFNQIVDSRPEVLLNIKYLLTGGEALSVKHVRKALQCLPGTQLINGYGPTEGTTFTTTYAIPRDWDGLNHPSVPIGRPLANTRCHILDDGLQPVPPGIPGELFIGGDGLALGYRDRPELTSERFVPDPFQPGSDQRLYRTGDLVRWLPDGNMEFLGRLDRQVKLRGFRIELAEIELALTNHTSVKDAIAMPYEAGEGDTRLIAYVKTDSGKAIDPGELRSHLQRTLPEYIIPAAFIALESFPLTSNGKIDRQALPRPNFGVMVTGRPPFAEPTTPSERLVVQVWSGLLGVERIGIHDHFFELGGHSLLAMRVVAQLNAQLSIQVPLRGLFEHPTARDLARWLDALVWATSPKSTGENMAEGEI